MIHPFWKQLEGENNFHNKGLYLQMMTEWQVMVTRSSDQSFGTNHYTWDQILRAAGQELQDLKGLYTFGNDSEN